MTNRQLKKLTILILIAIAYFMISIAFAASVWTAQPGWYKKQKSSAGKIRYVLTTIPEPAPANIDPCLQSAKFKCSADWGVVFNLDAALPNQCNRLYVKKTDLSDAALFSGYQVVNGEAICK